MGWMKFGRKGRKQRAQFESEALVHIDDLYSSAVYLTRDRDEAEDLVQDTMLKAYRNFHRYEPGTNCRAWLFRIMVNTFLNERRRRKRQVEFADDVDPDGADVADWLDGSAHRLDPERRVVSTMFSSTVRKALDALPPEFRSAVVLSDLHDFSYKEIAEIMDCPVGTVMSRIHRGRRLLQKQLFEYAQEQGIIEVPSEVSDGEVVSLETWRARHGRKGSA